MDTRPPAYPNSRRPDDEKLRAFCSSPPRP